MLSTLWTIAKNAFIEVIRQPVYAILLLIGMVLIAISPTITMFSMVEDEKLMVDMALATILMLGLVMSVFGASQVISREIEHETAGAVLSKPVGRLTFVVGKFLGVSMAMFLTTYLLTIALVVTLRIGVPSASTFAMDYPALLALVVPALLAIALGLYGNYFYRWNFTSTAMTSAVPLYTVGFAFLLIIGPTWQLDFIPEVFAARHAGVTTLAAVLVGMGVWVLSSVAVVASTRLNVVMNAIVCLAVFFVGMVSKFLFGQVAAFPLAWTSLGAILAGAAVLLLILGPWNSWAKGALGMAALGLVAVACYQAPAVVGVFAEFGRVYAWLARRIVPNLEVFWTADQLMSKVPFIPWTYVVASGAYAVGFCLAMVLLAAYLFEKREVI